MILAKKDKRIKIAIILFAILSGGFKAFHLLVILYITLYSDKYKRFVTCRNFLFCVECIGRKGGDTMFRDDLIERLNKMYKNDITINENIKKVEKYITEYYLKLKEDLKLVSEASKYKVKIEIGENDKIVLITINSNYMYYKKDNFGICLYRSGITNPFENEHCDYPVNTIECQYRDVEINDEILDADLKKVFGKIIEK